MPSFTDLSSSARLTIELVKRASITPQDGGCLEFIANRLKPLGFEATWLKKNNVNNLLLIRKSLTNDSAPLFALAGHVDVVPVGDESKWTHHPFSASIENDCIYGRGSCDMKGGLSALITATERFISNNADTSMDIAFIITSDEEGPAVDGTAYIIEHMLANQIIPKWCILAEPSSSEKVGDTIKNGRRGSMSGYVTLFGKQGHVGYPHLAKNPNHALPLYLQALLDIVWDSGNEYFDATTFQIVNIQSGTGASNVIPGEANFDMNWRFSSELTDQTIIAKVSELFDHLKSKTGVDFQIDWKLYGTPFLTEEPEDDYANLIKTAQSAIYNITGESGKLSTSGGISDGRYIAKTGCQIIELGTTNETIHKVNEFVSIDELDKVSQIYEEILNTII